VHRPILTVRTRLPLLSSHTAAVMLKIVSSFESFRILNFHKREYYNIVTAFFQVFVIKNCCLIIKLW